MMAICKPGLSEQPVESHADSSTVGSGTVFERACLCLSTSVEGSLVDVESLML